MQNTTIYKIIKKHKNIKTSNHQNIKTSKPQNIETSKHRNLKTSKHQTINTLKSNKNTINTSTCANLRALALPQYFVIFLNAAGRTPEPALENHRKIAKTCPPKWQL